MGCWRSDRPKVVHEHVRRVPLVRVPLVEKLRSFGSGGSTIPVPSRDGRVDLRVRVGLGIGSALLPASSWPTLSPSPSPLLPFSPSPLLPFSPSPLLPRSPLPFPFSPLPSPSPLLPFSPSPLLPSFPLLPFSPSPLLPFSPSPLLPFSPSPPLLSFSPSPLLPFPSPLLPFSPSPLLPFSPSPLLPFCPFPLFLFFFFFLFFLLSFSPALLLLLLFLLFLQLPRRPLVKELVRRMVRRRVFAGLVARTRLSVLEASSSSLNYLSNCVVHSTARPSLWRHFKTLLAQKLPRNGWGDTTAMPSPVMHEISFSLSFMPTWSFILTCVSRF